MHTLAACVCVTNARLSVSNRKPQHTHSITVVLTRKCSIASDCGDSTLCVGVAVPTDTRSVASRFHTYLTGAGAPQVHAAAQADGQHVLRRPVDQIQIEVVLQLRCVEHFERDARDLAGSFARRPQQLLALDTDRRQRVRALLVEVLGGGNAGETIRHLDGWCTLVRPQLTAEVVNNDGHTQIRHSTCRDTHAQQHICHFNYAERKQ